MELKCILKEFPNCLGKNCPLGDICPFHWVFFDDCEEE